MYETRESRIKNQGDKQSFVNKGKGLMCTNNFLDKETFVHFPGCIIQYNYWCHLILCKCEYTTLIQWVKNYLKKKKKKKPKQNKEISGLKTQN